MVGRGITPYMLGILKDYDVYLDAVDEANPTFNIGVVVVRLGQEFREEFIRGVLEAFNILYGNGKYVLEYAKKLGNPDVQGS